MNAPRHSRGFTFSHWFDADGAECGAGRTYRAEREEPRRKPSPRVLAPSQNTSSCPAKAPRPPPTHPSAFRLPALAPRTFSVSAQRPSPPVSPHLTASHLRQNVVDSLRRLGTCRRRRMSATKYCHPTSPSFHAMLCHAAKSESESGVSFSPIAHQSNFTPRSQCSPRSTSLSLTPSSPRPSRRHATARSSPVTVIAVRCGAVRCKVWNPVHLILKLFLQVQVKQPDNANSEQ